MPPWMSGDSGRQSMQMLGRCSACWPSCRSPVQCRGICVRPQAAAEVLNKEQMAEMMMAAGRKQYGSCWAYRALGRQVPAQRVADPGNIDAARLSLLAE